MKKIRAIRDEWTEDDVQFLAQLGIKANVGAKWDWIRIEEDERYFQIKKRCGHRWSCINDVIAYEYSKEEIKALCEEANEKRLYGISFLNNFSLAQIQDEFNGVGAEFLGDEIRGWLSDVLKVFLAAVYFIHFYFVKSAN